MKRVAAVLVFLCFLGALVAADAVAQMRLRGSGGWGVGGHYARVYDLKTVETMTGEVAVVERFTPMLGMSPGVHLLLKAGNETVSVHLGPSWYLENQDAKLERGDRVAVRGSRVMFQGKPAVIAAEVKKGDQILRLRDESGVPGWSGWRRPGAGS